MKPIEFVDFPIELTEQIKERLKKRGIEIDIKEVKSEESNKDKTNEEG